MSSAHTFDVALPPVVLESGVALGAARLRGWTAGPSGAARFDDGPVAVVVHALTGDADAASWWGPVVGVGGALDASAVRVISFNALGGCYGSTGPTDPGYPRAADPRLPAALTTWDQARALLQALDAIGVDDVALSAGGSLGGMVVLAAAVLDPGRFRRIAPIAACAAASPWIIGFNHVGRAAILADPSYPRAARGLAVARQLAMLSYRAEPGLIARHGRATTDGEGGIAPAWSADASYRVETYLEHQGEKLTRRFDAESYLVQLGAMSHHDLDRRPGRDYWAGADAPVWGVARISASTMAVGIDTDQLYFPAHARSLAASIGAHGAHTAYRELRSPHGHDAFLIEWDQVNAHLRDALAMPPSPKGPVR